MTMRLSPHFSLEELTVTEHRGIDNTPSEKIIAALTVLAENLEIVRAILGNKVISVTSGYRCRLLNVAVGGSVKSAHLTGFAADFNCWSYGAPLAVCQAIAATDLAFDQIIHEYGTWTHLSFAPTSRRELLTIDSKGTRQGLFPVRK